MGSYHYGLFFQIFRTSLVPVQLRSTYVSLASHTSVLAFSHVTSLELKKCGVFFKNFASKSEMS